MSLRSCLQVRKELGVAVTLGRMIDGEEISSLRPTRCHGASCFRMQARADRWHAGRRVPRNQERQWLPPGSSEREPLVLWSVQAREAVTRVQEALRRRATSRAPPPRPAPASSTSATALAPVCASGGVPPFGVFGVEVGGTGAAGVVCGAPGVLVLGGVTVAGGFDSLGGSCCVVVGGAVVAGGAVVVVGGAVVAGGYPGGLEAVGGSW